MINKLFNLAFSNQVSMETRQVFTDIVGKINEIIVYLNNSKNDNTIAKQTKELYELKEKLKVYNDVVDSISSRLYCIGGPLNDNVMNYSNKQLKIFFRIAEDIKNITIENEE